MSAQIILIACLLLLLTALIILGLCILNWRLYVALYQGNNLSSVWCFGRDSSSEERTAVVDRNPALESNPMINRECSMHLEQIDKLKRWHLSQLSSVQSTVNKEESLGVTTNHMGKDSNKVFNPSLLESSNNIYEDISATAIELHQLKPDSDNHKHTQSGITELENDPGRNNYTTLSDDYLDQSSIHSVRRVNIPAASSPVNNQLIRKHLAHNKRSWKLSPEQHNQTYEQFESTGVSCIYFHPEPDYEDSGLPETSLARGTLEKKIKEIP